MMFREVTEIIDSVNNKSFKIISIRLLIRYLTRFFGFKNASFLLSLLLFLFKKNSLVQKYNFGLYLIEINIYRNNCLDLFKKGEVSNQNIEKRKWAKFIIDSSKNKIAIRNARDYLKLIYDYDNYQFILSSTQKKPNKKIYLYGPKAEYLSSHYDCTIVLTKPVTQDLSGYKGSILFLNSYYFNKMVAHNKELQESLLKKYDEIYVSCAHSNLREGFIRINPLLEFDSGYLSGPMALGRLTQFLLKNYSVESCIVEGYDFYLSSELYNSHYPTSLRLSNGGFSEKLVCWSLVDHDALYNFLYVKKVFESIQIIKSKSFHNIIKMSGEEYMEKLFNIRDFSKL
jgi:hypothetical protein